MEIPLAVLADYANVAQGGKLNIMGVFNRFWSPKWPAALNRAFIVLKLEVDSAEYESEKSLDIRLIDADGGQKFNISGKLMIKRPPAGGRPPEVNQIIEMQGIRFEAPGEYAFKVMVNGDPKATIRLLAAEGKGTEAAQ